MWTDIDIINRALRLIRAQRLSSLSENTAIAQIAKDLFEPIKQMVLSLHPWNDAIKRVKLEYDVQKPVFGFAYQYSLPFDCLRITDCNSDSWQREGYKILSDNPKLDIIYIANIPSVGMGPNLIRVISARLAFEIAQSQAESSALTERLYQLYKEELQSAKIIDAKEAGISQNAYISSWITAHERG